MCKRNISFARFFAVMGFIFLFACASTQATNQIGSTQVIGKIEPSQLREVSGLHPVTDSDGQDFWVNNDGSADKNLYMISASGALKATVRVGNSLNRDWEDLTGFDWNDEHYLVIADVGDNAAKRSEIRLFITPEPVAPKLPLKDEAVPIELEVQPVAQIRLTYPNGARDCESVAVDMESQSIYFVSKRDSPPQIFRWSMREFLEDLPEIRSSSKLKRYDPVALEKVGVMNRLPPQAFSLAKPFSLTQFFAKQPTAMSMNQAGTLAAVLTYHQVYLFRKQPQQAWSAVMALTPEVLDMPALPQAEALALMPDDSGVVVMSEGVGSNIVFLPIPADSDPSAATNGR